MATMGGIVKGAALGDGPMECAKTIVKARGLGDATQARNT